MTVMHALKETHVQCVLAVCTLIIINLVNLLIYFFKFHIFSMAVDAFYECLLLEINRVSCILVHCFFFQLWMVVSEQMCRNAVHANNNALIFRMQNVVVIVQHP
jgi:hypothetical protein